VGTSKVLDPLLPCWVEKLALAALELTLTVLPHSFNLLTFSALVRLPSWPYIDLNDGEAAIPVLDHCILLCSLCYYG